MARSISETGPLAGRTPIVTGSGHSLRRASALPMAAWGADLVLNGRGARDAVDSLADEVFANGSEAIGLMADVSDVEQLARTGGAAVARLGSVDFLASNVGMRPKRPSLEVAPQGSPAGLRTHPSAAFYRARHMAPRMCVRHRSRVDLVSGFDGFCARVPGRAHTVIATAGLQGLVTVLGCAFSTDGRAVHAVAPGAIDTMCDWPRYTDRQRDRIDAEIPCGRCGRPHAVAAACGPLCSRRGGFMSAHAVRVNGGHHVY